MCTTNHFGVWDIWVVNGGVEVCRMLPTQCTTPIRVMSLRGRSGFEHQKVEYLLMEKHFLVVVRMRGERACMKEGRLIKINPDHSYFHKVFCRALAAIWDIYASFWIRSIR